MQVARSEHPAVVLNGDLVVVGGLVEAAGAFGVTATVESYDPTADSWSGMPDLPQARHHGMAAVVSGRLFVIGGFSASGFDPTEDVWELVGGTWVERSPLPRPLGAAAAAALDGTVYVVGGAPEGGLLAYDPGLDSWEELNPPAVSREHVAAVAFEGEIWAVAGRAGGEIHDTTEIYDPDTDTWRMGPGLGEARSGFGAAVVGGSMVVAGGEVFGPDRALNTTERYDPRRRVWEPFEPLPHGLHGNPLVVIDQTLYLPGGSMRAAGVDNNGGLWTLRVRG